MTRTKAKPLIKRLLFPLLPVSYRFSRLYSRGGWASTESVSGPGSTLECTQAIREKLPEVVMQLGVRSMLDAPCGDFHWMKQLIGKLPADFIYWGADIVAPLIDSLKKYESRNVRFLVADIRKDALPASDLVLCRDCLIHLSTYDVRCVLDNLKRSGAHYLLMTSFSEVDGYEDIHTGRFRPVNFERAPFSFPEPLMRIDDGDFRGKFLGLWRMEQVPA